MRKKAILWGYKYRNMRESWKLQMQWLVKALQEESYTVIKHKDFICQGLDNLPVYDFRKDICDIVIYNHCDISHIIGNVIPVKKNLFFKPTVPDKYHTTLDELGYGAYSSITYDKPDFESCNINNAIAFFRMKVKRWIQNRDTKFWDFENKETEVKENDYYLVLGQCGGDYVVTRQDFGIYFNKLEAVIRELARIGNRKIVVKLHPYTDGVDAKDDKFSQKIASNLRKIDSKVIVYLGKTNIHNFIEKAHSVYLANSGAGFEVMMHHKPIIAWGYPEYHWITYNLRHLCDLIRAIKVEDWFDAEKQDKFLYWYMEKYCYYNLKGARRRLKEILYGK